MDFVQFKNVLLISYKYVLDFFFFSRMLAVKSVPKVCVAISKNLEKCLTWSLGQNEWTIEKEQNFFISRLL